MWLRAFVGVGRVSLKDLWRCAVILGVKLSDATKRFITAAYDTQSLGVVSYEQMLLDMHALHAPAASHAMKADAPEPAIGQSLFLLDRFEKSKK